MGRLDVELRIWGDGAAITALGTTGLGQVWRKGDPIPGSPVMHRKRGGWSLASTAGPDESLETHVLSIRSQVAEQPAIVQAASVGEPELSIALYVGSEAPIVDLSTNRQHHMARFHSRQSRLDAYGWEPD